MTLNRREFKRADIDKLVEFVRNCPVAPFYDSTLIRRFLLDLVSSENLVCDLHDGHERVAVAVLLDKPQNAAGSANLEIVGLNAVENADSIFSTIFDFAKQELPKGRNLIDATYHNSLPIKPDFFLMHGFSPSYSVYEMKTQSPIYFGLKAGGSIRLESLTEPDFDEYHSVVMQAFAENEEANIPPLEEMRKRVFKVNIPPTILRDGPKIIGFLYAKIADELPDVGEVNTIGLLPAYRNRGLGALLLEESLRQLRQAGVSTYKLSVSAVNEHALRIYKRAGFEIAEKYTNFRWTRS